MLEIIQTDRVELPTPLDPIKPGLLVNIHLSSRPTSDVEMDLHARSLLEREDLHKYAGISVTFWLQSQEGKERLWTVEV